MKINPPVQMLITMIMIYIISKVLSTLELLIQYRWLFLIVPLSIGLFFIFRGLQDFKKADTTGNPDALEKVSSLVTSGIYKYTRNPMYVGLLFLLLAWALFLGSLFSIFIVILFQQYITKFQIIDEEIALLELFHHEYEEYCIKVNRWL